MEAAGLALSVVAAADLCIKYCKILAAAYDTITNADKQIRERVLVLQQIWKKTTVQLDFLKTIWDKLDAEHQILDVLTVSILESKLKTASTKLDRYLVRRNEGALHQVSTIKRLKYLTFKSHLDELIREIKEWQNIFDPTWFLIFRISSPGIDTALERQDTVGQLTAGTGATSATTLDFRNATRDEPQRTGTIFYGDDWLRTANITSIPYSTIQLVVKADSNTWLMINRVVRDPAADRDVFRSQLRVLAQKLSCGDAQTFGLPQCYRVVEWTSMTPRPFDMLFHLPSEKTEKPVSLRQLLVEQRSVSLTARFNLAKNLAKSVSYMHTLGFVHKNIRPETYLGYLSNSELTFFLLGFDHTRTADGQTLRHQSDDSFSRHLYRHPSRQGIWLGESYNMKHDIYSLGVCMLEIGVWDSFIAYDTDTQQEKEEKGEALQWVDDRRNDTKGHLVDLAGRKLPGSMGERYKEITVKCLKCLDQDTDEEEWGDVHDSDGVLIGVRFIEQVLLKLNNIQL